MFVAPSALEAFQSVHPTDPDALGGAGRVLWIPKARPDRSGIEVSGPVYYFHVDAGIAIRVGVYEQGASPTGDVSMDLEVSPWSRTNIVDFAGLAIRVDQFVLPSDVLVCRIAIRNADSRPRQCKIELEVVESTGEPSKHLRSTWSDSASGIEAAIPVCDGSSTAQTVHVRSEIREAFASGSVGARQSFVAAGERSLRNHGDGGVHASQCRVDPGEERELVACVAISDSVDRVRLATRLAGSASAPLESARHWLAFLGKCPQFDCSQQDLQQKFLSDCVDLHLSTCSAVGSASPYKSGFAGSREARIADADAACVRTMSARWLRSSAADRRGLLNFLHLQRSDGAVPTAIKFGRVPVFGVDVPNFAVFWSSYLVNPDANYLRQCYYGLADYASFVLQNGDRSASGLIDARIVPFAPETTFARGSEKSQMKGLRSSVNYYRLVSALASAAHYLGLRHDSDSWRERADQVRSAICEQLWDDDRKQFGNLTTDDGTWVSATRSDALIPYLTDVADIRHRDGLDSSANWGEVDESVELTEPAEPIGYAHLIADALLRFGLQYDDGLLADRGSAAFMRLVRRASLSESPVSLSTDAPSQFVHHPLLDQIVRYACGINLHVDGIRIKPCPFPVDSFVMDWLVIRNNHVTVWRRGDRFGVRLDGEEIASAFLDDPIELDIPLA
ncbi:MAG: hypothetical protein R2832_12270 [Rhodothermales bacterium]